MGEVYRAHDTRLHRDVALKLLPEPLSSDPDRVARFKREARVLASLKMQVDVRRFPDAIESYRSPRRAERSRLMASSSR